MKAAWWWSVVGNRCQEVAAMGGGRLRGSGGRSQHQAGLVNVVCSWCRRSGDGGGSGSSEAAKPDVHLLKVFKTIRKGEIQGALVRAGVNIHRRI